MTYRNLLRFAVHVSQIQHAPTQQIGWESPSFPNTPCLVLKIVVSCRFSIEPLHWLLGPANLSNLEFYTGCVRIYIGESNIHQNAKKNHQVSNQNSFVFNVWVYPASYTACGVYGVQLSSGMDSKSSKAQKTAASYVSHLTFDYVHNINRNLGWNNILTAFLQRVLTVNTNKQKEFLILVLTICPERWAANIHLPRADRIRNIIIERPRFQELVTQNSKMRHIHCKYLYYPSFSYE